MYTNKKVKKKKEKLRNIFAGGMAQMVEGLPTLEYKALSSKALSSNLTERERGREKEKIKKQPHLQ
jgi:hypothetical protein